MLLKEDCQNVVVKKTARNSLQKLVVVIVLLTSLLRAI